MKFLEETKASKNDPDLDGFRLRMISSYRQGNPLVILEEADNSDKLEIQVKEMEMRRFHQAILARRLKILTGARRLVDEGQRGTSSLSEQNGEAELTPTLEKLESGVSFLVAAALKLLGRGQSEKTSPLKKLQSDEQKILKLSNIRLFSEVEGHYREISLGTLEAHVNGLLYMDDSGYLQVHILYEKIDVAFCLVGDVGLVPLLHFSLHDHMGGTKDIQFRRSDEPLGEALLNFANGVQAIWGAQPMLHRLFEKLEMNYKFSGKLPLNEQESIFYLTLYSLVRLDEAPSIMVGLREIEIVNLAELEPGEIEMTVILQDFNRDIVRIVSIPLDSLDVIKCQLDLASVKFYENKLSLNWEKIVQGIIDNPKGFIDMGGWDFFGLETDEITLGYYSESSHGTDSPGAYD